MERIRKISTVTYVTIAAFIMADLLFFGKTLSVNANSVTDEISITIPASCSLTNTVSSAHTATIETGVYQENIGETTFKVFCNDSEGFAVYAVGFTNDEFGNNTLKPTVVDNSNAVATGTVTSGNTSNWAMKLSAVSGTYAPTIHSTEENNSTYSFTNYHTIPSEYTKVASYASNTDVTTGSSFKSTYAAFISQTQLADSYTGKVKYTVVHPSSELAPIENIAQLTYMQDFKDLKADERTAVLNSMQYNTTYNLIDNRDNKTYQIARLKDDNIWMAENLDLGRTELTQDLTSQNTNLDTNVATITSLTFNGWIKTSGTQTYTSAELIPVAGTDSVSNTPYGTLYNYCAASAGTICTSSNSNDAASDLCPAGWRLPIGGSTGEFRTLYNLGDYSTPAKMRTLITGGGVAFTLAGSFYDSTPTNQDSVGLYWSSTRYNSSNMYLLSINASSVYPADGYSRYNGGVVRCVTKKPHILTVTYGVGVSNIQVNDVTVPDGGTIEVEEGFPYSITMTPSAGYGFTSWAGDSGTIESVGDRMTVYTAGNSDVVLTANASYVTTEIQNLSSSACTTTASYARDNRDNHVYTIKRLADGNCWMMENLDLGRTELTTDLTSSNTNLTNAVTASTFNGWKMASGYVANTVGEFISVEGTDPTSKTPYGTIYNYCATSANTICSAEEQNNDDATSDLCPAGWRLPTGGSSGEFQALYSLTDYNSNGKMRAPITSGGVALTLSGSPANLGSWGFYSSSTRPDNSNIYVFTLNASGIVYPYAKYNRESKYSVRCIMKTS